MKNGDNPAFPYASQDAFVRGGMAKAGISLAGLTKREAFAMAAMQGILANPSWNDGGNPKHVAGSAIVFAEELLKQLES